MTNQASNGENAEPRRTARGHNHAEAFHLMLYACRHCGHRERFWNSRDGVTPFCTQCPSCGEPELTHVEWHRDVYAPNHKPHEGQRLWVSMTRARAELRVRLRIAAWAKEGHTLDPSRIPAIVADEFKDGAAPDLRVFGYTEDGE